MIFGLFSWITVDQCMCLQSKRKSSVHLCNAYTFPYAFVSLKKKITVSTVKYLLLCHKSSELQLSVVRGQSVLSAPPAFSPAQLYHALPPMCCEDEKLGKVFCSLAGKISGLATPVQQWRSYPLKKVFFVVHWRTAEVSSVLGILLVLGTHLSEESRLLISILELWVNILSPLISKI